MDRGLRRQSTFTPLEFTLNLFTFSLGSIFEESCRHSVPMPSNLDVHLCLCLLLEKEQSVNYFWSIHLFQNTNFARLLLTKINSSYRTIRKIWKRLLKCSRNTLKGTSHKRILLTSSRRFKTSTDTATAGEGFWQSMSTKATTRIGGSTMIRNDDSAQIIKFLLTEKFNSNEPENERMLNLVFIFFFR